MPEIDCLIENGTVITMDAQRRVLDNTSVAVHGGKIVEVGEADAVYASPAHHYTRMLLDAVPVPDPAVVLGQDSSPRGEAPSPANPPSGCRFRTRCPRAKPVCAEFEPSLVQIRPGGQHVACHFPIGGPAQPLVDTP